MGLPLRHSREGLSRPEGGRSLEGGINKFLQFSTDELTVVALWNSVCFVRRHRLCQQRPSRNQCAVRVHRQSLQRRSLLINAKPALRRMGQGVSRADAFMMPPFWNAWYVADEHGVDRSARLKDRFATVALSSAGGPPRRHAPDSRTRSVTLFQARLPRPESRSCRLASASGSRWRH